MKSVTLLKTYLLACLVPVIWGSTYVVTTELLPDDIPLLAAVIRALPAGLILLVVGGTLPRGEWWWKALVLGTLNIGAFFYLLFAAAYLMPGGIAALLMSSQPLFVLLLGGVLLKECIHSIKIVACLVGTFGVGLLVVQPHSALNPAGIIISLLGALSMALGVVLTKRWGRPENVSLLGFTGWQLTAGGLVLLPIALSTEALPASLSVSNVVGFLYLSLIGALFAYVIWFRSLQTLPAFSVSFITMASPLSATVLGYLILDQQFSLMQAGGALLILAAMVLAQIKPAERAKPSSTAFYQAEEKVN
ncbi:EamA family transporter [Vibrio sp. TRT 17S01]|uniref:EamA family transporter n=1 Tax=Vibrio sp. TRT 17S01 TaxID=3418505 RepID=UPI003CEC4203